MVILLFLSCEKSNDSHDFISAVESELGVTATPSPLGGESVFFESVAYGSAERQQLDISCRLAMPLKEFSFFTAVVLQLATRATPTMNFCWKPCKPS